MRIKRAPTFSRIYLLVWMLLLCVLPSLAQTREEKLALAKQTFDEGVTLTKQQTLEASQTAREKFLAASRLYRENNEKSGQAQALVWAGFISNNLGEKRIALEYFEESLPLLRLLGEKNGEAVTLNNIGLTYSELGEKQKALDYFNQALPLSRGLGDKRGEALVLNNIGLVYSDLGENQKALDYYHQALPLRRSVGDKRGEAVTLNNIGKIYSTLGEKQKALEYYNQALPLRRAIGDKSGEALTLSNIGKVYDDLGEKQKALEFYNQALPLLRLIGDKSGEANTLNGIGKVYFNLGEKQKALEYFNQALPLCREVEDKQREALTLNNLGAIYDNLGEKQKALDFYRQALPLTRLVGDREGEATALNNIGRVYDELGEKQKALEYFNQALPLSRAIGDKDGEATTLHNVMFVWKSLNNQTLAIFYGKQAVNLKQQLRSNIKGLDKSIQQSFLKSVEDTYRYLADILIAEERFAEAQAVLDLIKDEEFEQLARSDEIAVTIPYSQTELEVIAKIDQLASLRGEQIKLRQQQEEQGAQFPSDQLKRLKQIEADLKTVNAEFETALAVLAKADTTVESQVAEIGDGKNLQSALLNLGQELKTGAVALYTVIGTEEEKTITGNTPTGKTRSRFGWVILVTPQERKAYPIDVENLEQLVFQFRAALSTNKYDPRPLAEKLYQAIFRQKSSRQKITLEEDLQLILGQSQNKTLMWSLDGILRYIPMSALYDGRQYLVEKYENVVFTKESLLWLTKLPKQKTQALGLGVSAGNLDLKMTKLPGVERELSEIIKQTGETTGILEGVRKINAQFKKEEIKNLKKEDNKFQVVHIASHYSFNPTDQNASYLLIGDGKLTFGDMKMEQNLFGTVDLLTLSACDTATSANGKESEGFAYLAQRLGAKSVIASLWEVSDAGTSKLMVSFYKFRAEHPDLPKGEAFRQAQLMMLGAETKINPKPTRLETVEIEGRNVQLQPFEKDLKKPFAHPFYWASFVLIGNWR